MVVFRVDIIVFDAGLLQAEDSLQKLEPIPKIEEDVSWPGSLCSQLRRCLLENKIQLVCLFCCNLRVFCIAVFWCTEKIHLAEIYLLVEVPNRSAEYCGLSIKYAGISLCALTYLVQESDPLRGLNLSKSKELQTQMNCIIVA